jgi:hypothetical protein
MSKILFRKIDGSTTYSKVHTVKGKDNILMKKFASEFYRYYDPQKGFGYFYATGDELCKLQPHKKVVLMEEVYIFITVVVFNIHDRDLLYGLPDFLLSCSLRLMNQSLNLWLQISSIAQLSSIALSMAGNMCMLKTEDTPEH